MTERLYGHTAEEWNRMRELARARFRPQTDYHRPNDQKDECPGCGGLKRANAKLCRTCHLKAVKK